jgi:hypothetical protein
MPTDEARMRTHASEWRRTARLFRASQLGITWRLLSQVPCRTLPRVGWRPGSTPYLRPADVHCWVRSASHHPSHLSIIHRLNNLTHLFYVPVTSSPVPLVPSHNSSCVAAKPNRIDAVMLLVLPLHILPRPPLHRDIFAE